MSESKIDVCSFSPGEDGSRNGKTVSLAGDQHAIKKQKGWPVLSFSKERNLLFGQKFENAEFENKHSHNPCDSQGHGSQDNEDFAQGQGQGQRQAFMAKTQPTGYFKTLVFLRFLAVAVLVAAALVLVALLLKASLLPSAIAGVVVGLSALAYNAIFGSAIAAGALAVVSTLPLYLAHKKESFDGLGVGGEEGEGEEHENGLGG